MNKTVTVNLGGIVFHIDENAYDALQKYLNSIRSHFTSADGRDEIMQDIESRIAEMFMERVKNSKQVITLIDVEEITAIMGKPEDFAGEGESKFTSGEDAAEVTYKKRLFRNPDDKMIGGVCSGLAAYFNVDVVAIRIIWAVLLLAFGTGALLYFILWVVMPEAKTTAEKLQMRGEPINVSNIEKNIKEEAEAFKNRAKEWSKEGGKTISTGIGRTFEAIGDILRGIFAVIGKLVLVFLGLVGLIVCFGLVIGLLGVLGLPGVHIGNMADVFFNNHNQLTWGYIGIMLTVGIPFLMLAIKAIGGLFHIKTNSRYVGGSAIGLWILGIVICLFIAINLAKEFKEDESVSQQVALIQPMSDTLILKSTAAHNEYDEHKYTKRRTHNGIHINEDIFSDHVELDIVKNSVPEIALIKRMTASGNTRDEAKERATRTMYSFQQKDSLLLFETDFKLPAKEKYRHQKVQLILRVPVGKYVYIDESMSGIIYDIDNVKSILDGDMIGRTWKMTDAGLVCVDCTGKERTKYGHPFIDDEEALTVNIEGPDSSIVKVYKNGVRVESTDPDIKVNIDENGIRVKEKRKKD